MAENGVNEEDGLELGLGLSLCGGSGSGKAKGSRWGDYGRILTAKDFPNGFSSATKKRVAAESVSPPPEPAAAAASTNVSSQVVGWPPLRTYRVNNLSSQTKTPNVGEDKGDKSKDKGKKKVNHGGQGNGKAEHVTGTTEIKGNLGFVKVNIDGLPIGRKVDLNSHVCYETLAQAIEEMFFGPTKNISPICKEKAKSPSKLLDGSSEFALTYEDKEGDWMLVGDVPWRMFLNTVKRLRIMRTSEANGLDPRCQEQTTDKGRSKPI